MSRITLGKTCWKVSDQTLGFSFGGGTLICKSGGVGWIVAPSSTEVSRDWFNLDDSVTTAEANAACGDWFVPTGPQFQNPGHCCQIYWDASPACDHFWTSTELSATSARCILFYPGAFPQFDGALTSGPKTNSAKIRAFRCVTY